LAPGNLTTLPHFSPETKTARNPLCPKFDAAYERGRENEFSRHVRLIRGLSVPAEWPLAAADMKRGKCE